MKKSFQIWNECLPQGRLFNTSHVVVTPVTECALHAHDFAEVFWVCRGTGCHTINGRRQIMQMGDLSMIRPIRDIHTARAISPDFTIINVAFPVSVLHSLRRRYYKSFDFWGGTDPLPGLYHLTEVEQQWLNAAGRELVYAPQERMVLDRFLLDLLGSTGKSITDPYRACPGWLRTACEAIHRREHLDGGLKTFFSLAHRSKEHVARTLKQRTGKTPTDVVNEARMYYAAGQLVTTSRDIIDIVMDCGYDSLTYFYTLFRKTFGLSPRRYRLTYFKAPIKRLWPATERSGK